LQISILSKNLLYCVKFRLLDANNWCSRIWWNFS